MVDLDEDPFAYHTARKERRKGVHASQERRPREKVITPNARSKGKTITVSYRVTPEWRRLLEQLAADEAVSMTEILERALDVYGKKRKRKR